MSAQATHTVAAGESIYAIAQQHGFVSWKAIYDHSENAALRERRPDPHVLHPGDVLVIPPECPGGTPVGLNQITRLTLRKRGFQPLRLRMTEADGSHLEDQPFTLRWEGGEASGETRDGEVRAEVPADAAEVTLVLGDEELTLLVGALNPAAGEVDDAWVTGAQARLSNLGYATGPVDGDLGEVTEEAIRDFQTDCGLEVTGQLDEATRDELILRHGG